jgi:HlyD family secretion protein
VKKIIIGAVIVAIIAGAVYLVLRKNGDEQQYTTKKVSLGKIRSQVTATGTVNAVTTVLVGTQVSGTIKSLYVDFNSYVKKEQLLAQIDAATFDAQVQQARANLAVAQANVKKSEAALIDTRRQFNRNKELFARKLIAKSDLETTETNELSAVAQLEATKAQVEQTKAALQVAETNLQYTRIISPVDGMVISRSVDVGQTVAASFQTPTLFTIAQDLAKMQIDTSVDEADIGKITKDQTVEFSVDAYPEKIFKGRVSVIRNAPITVQNVVTYDVVVLVPNPDKILKPGMTANVSIITAEKNNVLAVPNAALRFRPPEKADATKKASEPKPLEAKEPDRKGPERKGPAVWRLENNKPKRISITVGISDGSNTEVASGELKTGDEVIVSAVENKNKAGSSLTRRLFH